MRFHLIENDLLMHPVRDYPCYRKVICYGFFRYMKAKELDAARSEFDSMINNFKQNKLFVLDKYVEIYPVVMTNEGNKGYLVVEPSRACFPLVVRFKSRTQLNGVQSKSRKSALKAAIHKLEKNKSHIFSILEKYEEWNSDLEFELEKVLEYPGRGKSNNDPIYNNAKKKRA